MPTNLRDFFNLKLFFWVGRFKVARSDTLFTFQFKLRGDRFYFAGKKNIRLAANLFMVVES